MAYVDNVGMSTLINKIKNDFATKVSVNADIAAAIANITQFTYSIVEELPNVGESGVLYLVINSGTAPNTHNEYVWIGNSFEMVGSASVDLSGYIATDKLIGDIEYTVVNTDSNTGNTTVSLSAGAISALIKANNAVQVSNTISDAEIIAMFNGVFTAIVTGLYKAPLHDTTAEDPIPDNELVYDYSIVVGTAINNENNTITVPIVFYGNNLQEHKNGVGTNGYWMGVSFPKTILVSGYNVEYYRGFGEYIEPANNEWTPITSEYFDTDTNIAESGEYCSFYREVSQAKENDNKAFVAFRYKESSIIIKTVIYKYDYTNVTIEE